jgi:hypothetical protein
MRLQLQHAKIVTQAPQIVQKTKKQNHGTKIGSTDEQEHQMGDKSRSN